MLSTNWGAYCPAPPTAHTQFLKIFELIDVDLTERDATLAFVWARMGYIDEQEHKSHIKMTHLSFEDVCALHQPS